MSDWQSLRLARGIGSDYGQAPTRKLLIGFYHRAIIPPGMKRGTI